MANLELYTKLRKQIENKQFAPIYLLDGEEPFYIDRLSRLILDHSLEEHERDFNLTVVYGNEANPDQMLESLRKFPMMAERNVVIFREAQNMDARYWPRFEKYFEQPTPSTVFLIVYKEKKANGNLKWVKTIKEKGVRASFDKHYDNEIPDLITKLVKGLKYRISAEAAAMLAEYLGSDLEKIEMELNKLTISVPLSKQIDVADIQEHIGFSKEFSVFDYVDAVAVKNTFKSFQIGQFLGRNDKNNPFVLIISMLYNHFSQLMIIHGHMSKGGHPQDAFPRMKNQFFARKFMNSLKHYNGKSTSAVISMLREYDAKFKGVGSTDFSQEDAMKELTFRLLNA